MHFDGPANGRANGQLFHGDADAAAQTLGLWESIAQSQCCLRNVDEHA
jgi:hypothetical protein